MACCDNFVGDICRAPADTHTNCKNEACHLLFIQCPICAIKYGGCCSDTCKGIINLPGEERKEMRKGVDKGRMVFNKSKQRQIKIIHNRER